MSNLSIQTKPALTPIATPAKPAATTETKAPAAQPGLKQDAVIWKEVPASTRIKTAIATTFKSEVIPYTIGGALAAPVGGALLGGFIGMFGGQPGKGAIEGAKMALKYAPITAAAGAGIAGVDALAMGTAVGSAPDRHSAQVRVGAGTAILGLLTADDKWDMLGAGVSGVAESARAGKIFDKTNEALQKK